MTQPADLQGLTQLGQGKAAPQKTLETFPNRHPNRRYLVTLITDEFTAVCPITGQPDFATIRVEYIPNQRVVESKSFKLYIWSYRNEGIFHEHVTNVILDDLIAALDPHYCKVTGEFSVRGGVAITVVAEHHREGSATTSSVSGVAHHE
jgi:7-cyano-7-deazaguanine reductase